MPSCCVNGRDAAMVRNLLAFVPLDTKVLLSSRVVIVVWIDVTAEMADGGGEGGSCEEA